MLPAGILDHLQYKLTKLLAVVCTKAYGETVYCSVGAYHKQAVSVLCVLDERLYGTLNKTFDFIFSLLYGLN